MKHVWHLHNFGGLTTHWCCRVCGVVRNKLNEHRECKGEVRIVTRSKVKGGKAKS